MISLRFNNIENIINFDERYINILEIADKNLFKAVTYNINKCVKDKENKNIIMFDDDKVIDIDKEIFIVNDFFNIDLNNTKVLKLLHKDISLKYNLEYEKENLLLQITDVYNDLIDILNLYEFNFTHKEEVNIEDLIKILNIKFDENIYDNPFDNLMYLFDVVSNFKICKVIILINAKLFFNEKELYEIYKVALYKDIKLLLVEYGSDDELLNFENKLCIDGDFDEFEIKV